MAQEDRLKERLERHWPALHAFLRLHAGPAITQKESSADLAQSVCRDLLRDLAKLEDRGDEAFKSLLFTRASLKIADRRRFYARQKRAAKEQRLSRISEQEADSVLGCYRQIWRPSEAAASHEEIARIERAFEELPEHWREVVVLCRIAGFSTAEVAERTGRTDGQVRGLLARALARLALRLKEPAD